MASAIYLSSYDDGREKFILTCAQWRICFDFKQAPLTEPRTAVENLLKALLFQHLEISDFSLGNFDALKIRGVIPNIRNRNGFGFANCLEILVWYFRQNQQPYFIPQGIEQLMKNINGFAVPYTHGPDWYSLREVMDVDDQLEQIINWYFTQIENVPDWNSKEIKPRIDKLLDTIPQQIAEGTGKYILENRTPKLSEADREKITEKYFKYLENECGYIQFEGLFAKSQKRTIKSSLEESFVHTGLTKSHSDSDKRYEISDLLQTTKRLIVVANPGSGKTTLLKSIAIACAFPERGKKIFYGWENNQLFPIYIRCRDLHEKALLPIHEIITYVASWAEIRADMFEMFNQLVKEKIDEGKVLLLIDGLDEISRDEIRTQFTNQLSRFFNAHPDSRAVIVSRDFGVRLLESPLLLVEDFGFYQLATLTDIEIEELCINWHKIALGDKEKATIVSKEVVKEIRYEAHTLHLAQNPLVLTTLLLVRYNNKKLPSNKAVLYEETIKLLIYGWNVAAHGEVLLDYDETKMQLAFVAFWLFKNEKQTIGEGELRDCLKNARKKIDRKIDFSIDDFIRRVEKRTGLLRKVGEDHYEFIHLSFQEFLSAVAMVEEHVILDDFRADLYVTIEESPSDYKLKNASFAILCSTMSESAIEVHEFAIELCGQEETNLFIEYLLRRTESITNEDKQQFNRLAYMINTNNADIADIFGISIEEFESQDEKRAKKIAEEKLGVHFLISMYKYETANLLAKYLLNNRIEGKKLEEQVLQLFLTKFAIAFQPMRQSFRQLFHSKCRIEIINFVKQQLSNDYQEDYLPELVFMLSEICDKLDQFWNPLPSTSFVYHIDEILDTVKKEVFSSDKATKCLGFSRLLSIYPEMIDFSSLDMNFQIALNTQEDRREKIEDIFSHAFEPGLLQDMHCYHIIGEALFVISGIWEIEVSNEYFQVYLKEWFSHCLSNTRNPHRYRSAMFLTRMLHPNKDISVILTSGNNREIITRIYENPQSYIEDKLVAAYLGIIIGIQWEVEPLKKIFERVKDTSSKRLFAAKAGIDVT